MKNNVIFILIAVAVFSVNVSAQTDKLIIPSTGPVNIINSDFLVDQNILTQKVLNT